MLMKYRVFPILLIALFLVFPMFNVAQANEMALIEMSFKNADLHDIFRVLSEVAGVNLITDNSVAGTVTIHFKGVTFLEALELLTRANKLAYNKTGNTYYIASQERLKSVFAQKLTQVFYLENADPVMIKEVVEKVDEELSVEIDKRLNALIVSCEKPLMEQITVLLKELDAPKSLIVMDVRVEEVSSSGLRDLGVSADSLRETGIHFLRGDDGSFNVDITFPDFLHYLEEEGLAYNLANPRLTTVDGETGRLHIGDRIPVRVDDDIIYLDAGIMIQYTARASRDGYITMTVSPQVSTIGEAITEGFPHIRTRQVDTEIRIKSGDTFAIGGLRQTKEIESMSKIPFLGDLPILGQLFRRTKVEQTETELVIFIKATAILPEGNMVVENVKKEEREIVQEITQVETEEILYANKVDTPIKKDKEPREELDIPPHIARWLKLFEEGKSLVDDED